MINHKKYFVKHNEKLNLSKISTSDTNGLKSKKDAESKLTKNIGTGRTSGKIICAG